MTLTIHEIPVTPFEQNCTLVVCESTQKVVVIDCGDAAPVLARIAELGVEVELILATHGHLDHIGGTADLKDALGVRFLFPSGDDFWRVGLTDQARMYGFGEVRVPEPDGDIHEGDRIPVGEGVLEVLHCPGHTPGHMVFYDAEGGQLIAGDVIFQGSIGRTDFPRGSFEELEASIRTKLYPLAPETVVHCGHGPTTTIGHEAATNPFVRP